MKKKTAHKIEGKNCQVYIQRESDKNVQKKLKNLNTTEANKK